MAPKSSGTLDFVFIAVITFLAYSNSLKCGFTFDDSSAIVNNVHVHTNSTPWYSVFTVDYWGTPIHLEHSHKSYRPVTMLTFRLDYYLSGLQPFTYHLFNVQLHILVTLIVYKFMFDRLGDTLPSLVGALFFSLHSLKTEVVSGIVGRAELLSSFFFMSALFCYFNSSNLCYVFCVILASLCKEQGLTIPCVCIVLEIAHIFVHYKSINGSFQAKFKLVIRNTGWMRILALSMFTVSLLVVRFYVMGNTLPAFTKFDNPASYASTPTRQLTYNYLLALNSWLMLYPLHLCADWTMNSIPLVRDIYDVRNLATLAFYSILGLALLRSISLAVTESESKNFGRKNILVLALSLTIVPFIPASNLMFPVGFVIAERVLYTPSIGYSLLLAIGMKKVNSFCRFSRSVCSSLFHFCFNLCFCLSFLA